MENWEIEKLKEQAVEAALCCNYAKAIELNLNLLKQNPKDVDILMQLAHAYSQNGQLNEAEKNYKKILHLNPNNQLAKKKSLALINLLRKRAGSSNGRKSGKIVAIADLIEEPGKTKSVHLSNLGKPEDLSFLNVGEEVFLSIRKRKIEVRDIAKKFIGNVPDDISKRLIEFINAQSTYEAFIFSLDKNDICVFIRELKKGTRVRQYSSFITENTVNKNIILALDDEEEKNKENDEDEEEDLDFDPENEITKNLSEGDDKEEEEEDPEDYHHDDFEE